MNYELSPMVYLNPNERGIGDLDGLRSFLAESGYTDMRSALNPFPEEKLIRRIEVMRQVYNLGLVRGEYFDEKSSDTMMGVDYYADVVRVKLFEQSQINHGLMINYAFPIDPTIEVLWKPKVCYCFLLEPREGWVTSLALHRVEGPAEQLLDIYVVQNGMGANIGSTDNPDISLQEATRIGCLLGLFQE